MVLQYVRGGWYVPPLQIRRLRVQGVVSLRHEKSINLALGLVLLARLGFRRVTLSFFERLCAVSRQLPRHAGEQRTER